MDKEVQELTRALAEPFAASEVKSKPAVISGSRALAMFYVDARVIQDRLDGVLGVVGWQDEYEVLPDGCVVCKLRLRLGGEWITKTDVGSPSEQPHDGDKMKAAFSDALKRAAVKFGLGRYLYRIPAQWVEYDPCKKCIVSPPQLPDFARPKGTKPAPKVSALPATAKELIDRLTRYEAALVKQGVCQGGELFAHVEAEGEKALLPEVMDDWPAPSFPNVVEWVKQFEASCHRRAKNRKPQPAGVA